MKIEFDMRQLRRRILQPTADLMAEVASNGVTPCGKGQRYAFRDNGAPVLAVAHCDYVDCGSDHFLAHKGKVWSSRLDDRLGVYVILDVLPSLGINVDVLLTDDEERGHSTAQYFQPTNHHKREYNWMVQFDRRGTGAVCYDYREMESYLTLDKLFDVYNGSFSDICWLDHLGVCGVNIGTAYYDEHSLGSYAVMAKLRDQLRRFSEFFGRYSDTAISHTVYAKRGASYSRGSILDDDNWRDLNRYDSVESFDNLLEWHDCGGDLFYAEGLGRDEYEITYVGDDVESFGFPWRLSTHDAEEWFGSLGDAQVRAQEMYDGVV